MTPRTTRTSFSLAMARTVFAVTAACSFLAPAAQAAGDAAAGAQKAATCAACHGMEGVSINPEWPSIAGQHASYVSDTLHAFKKGSRENVLMTAQAMILSDEDIADLSAYYAGKAPARGTADPALAKAGERLYRGGDQQLGISACIACHGPAGRGNAPAAYPSLTGQHATYTAKQLRDYKAGRRTSDGDTQVMRNITARLSDEQIDAVAAYIEGLR